ncbi:MAG: hypothetical protein D6705_14625 [Deltaproteobacteria bacterium]|nr:MAG: hypothetical protein D6705_14625 [Deltaproteobacteria bacterium]
MVRLRRRVALACALSLSAPALVACPSGETRHDVYMKGLQIEGEAERGPCKLTFDGGMRAQVLSSAQINECLRMQEAAIAEYERAAEMGMKGDPAFERTYARALERKKRLESMRSNVARMEREQVEAKAAEPAPLAR